MTVTSGRIIVSDLSGFAWKGEIDNKKINKTNAVTENCGSLPVTAMDKNELPEPLYTITSVFKMDFSISTKYTLKSLVTIVLLSPLSHMNKNSQTLKSTLITNAVTIQSHKEARAGKHTGHNTHGV